MQILISPLLSAPQVTGHPQGLPADQPDPPEQTRVQPVSDARDPEARMKEGQTPTQFWSAVNGKPDPDSQTAPPSIMQITISRMLDEQNPAHKPPTQAAPEDNTEAVPEHVNEAVPTEDPDRSADPVVDPGADPGREQAITAPAEEARQAALRAHPDGADPPAQPPEATEARRSVFSTLP